MRFSSERLHQFEVPDSYKIEEALNVATSTGNLLLLDYCKAYLALHNRSLVDDPIEAIAAMGNLRWLDTSLTSDDNQLDPEILLRGKIDRTMQQIQALRNDEGYMSYVAIPALNEEDSLPVIMRSFESQVTDSPVVIVVADNNSTDSTGEVVEQMGGNSIAAPNPGIGPARQHALDAIMADVVDHAERAVIIQTDADCVAAEGYINSVIKKFQASRAVKIGVGPSIYSIPLEDGRVIELSSGRDYKNLLGTVGIQDYFRELNREAGDYLLEPPYRYIIGPNTSLRASVFSDHPRIMYPGGDEWESIHMSIKLQQHVPSETGIGRIDGQCMQVSSRAILGDSDVLTSQRLNDIRAHRYVGPYKAKTHKSPFNSMKAVVLEIDTATYEDVLRPGQSIFGVVDANDARARDFETIPARHGATGEQIVGKVALIDPHFYF